MIKPPKLIACLTSLMLCGNQRLRRLVLRFLDIAIYSFSIYFAAAVRLETLLPSSYLFERSEQVVALILFKSFVFHAIGLYKPLLRYSKEVILTLTAQGVILSTFCLISVSYFVGHLPLSRSILIIDALLTLTLVVSARLLLRQIIRKSILKQKRGDGDGCGVVRLLIYGAGSAGIQLLHALSDSYQYQVVGFTDDNPELQKQSCIDGLSVYTPAALPTLYASGAFDCVVIAMPSVPQRIRNLICKKLQNLSIPMKTTPSLDDILAGRVSIQEMRDIDIVDLLGREEVQPVPSLLSKQITEHVVLVTGAGGSIGSELCRQIAQQHPQRLILFELSEYALYTIHQELIETYPDVPIVPILGDVTDKSFFCRILREFAVQTIYHAAAYKHVPLLESNVLKGVENNVLGTLAVGQGALECGVKQFVLISTDKAVRPTNIMGATKRIAELIVQGLASQATATTAFAIVRFGNVLGSSGSVVPRFQKQIAAGGPITLTHPDITRYFMSIPEAARLVIQAGAMASGGQVFLLDMGRPVRIYDLAERMIQLCGLIPHEDIQIAITGLRPGEKLYEELLIAGDNIQPTCHPKIFAAKEYYLPWGSLEPKLNKLMELTYQGHVRGVRRLIQQLVPEYHLEPAGLPPTPTAAPLPIGAAVNSWASN